MNQVPVKLGPLALLLTVISICLTTLSILTFTTSRADMRLSERYAATVSTRYELEVKGQEALKLLDEGDMGAFERTGNGELWQTIEKDGFLLKIGVVEEDDGFRVIGWRHEREWTENLDIGNLWPGMG